MSDTEIMSSLIVVGAALMLANIYFWRAWKRLAPNRVASCFHRGDKIKVPDLLKRLFRRNVTPKFDIEKAVGHNLLTLPRCTRRVLVVSRNYGDQRYNYEMTVDAASLAAWAVKHEQGAWSSNKPEQAARKALPFWLSNADLSDNDKTRIPEMFFAVLREYHSTFLEMPGTQVFCHECRHVVDVSKESTQLPRREIFDCWFYEWHCPKGHLLYQEKVERHGDSRNRVTAVVNGEEMDISTFLRKLAD